MIPLSSIEGFVSAYGISEMLPAARPPLGGTARLLIALAAGIFVAALLYSLFPRKGFSDMATAMPRMTNIGDFFRSLRFGRSGGAPGEVSDFDDLPRLRNADAHPDAPARRPIFANSDLGAPLTLDIEHFDDGDDEAGIPVVDASPVTNEAEQEPETVAEEPGPAEPAPGMMAEIAIPEEPVEAVAPQPPDVAPEPAPQPHNAYAAPVAAPRDPHDPRPLSDLSIGELVARLEQGMAERFGAAPALVRAAGVFAEKAAVADVPEHPVEPETAPAEQAAEPDTVGGEAAPISAEGMDAALQAALETLRVMTERQKNAS